uniref:Uncharacterized protein n=1 Tax=Strigamia maritima TaxID=126957 RepID=T1IQZ6_STRMM
MFEFNSKAIHYYTGFENYVHFHTFMCLGPSSWSFSLGLDLVFWIENWNPVKGVENWNSSFEKNLRRAKLINDT